MTGPATRDELHKLHRLITKAMLRRLRDEPSAEDLQTARRLVADNGITASTGVDRKALRRLHALYLKALLRALLDTERRPPATVLSECGYALRAAGIQVETRTEERAVVDLASFALPFLSH